MLLRDGRPLVSFGVMGGDMQAQGHVQVVSNLVDYGCNIQEAIDCAALPLSRATDRVALEARAATPRVGATLARRGHVVRGRGRGAARAAASAAGRAS